jgi:MFS family permease
MVFNGFKQLDRSLYILLIGVLLTHIGTYMVLPMLPIILKTDADLSVVQIGTILASIAIAFQFGSIFGGILADRIGRRFIIGLGAIITAVGISGFGFFTGYLALVLMAIVMGLGTGLNAPSTKASIAALASKENQTTAFSMRGIAANIGTAIAGLVIIFLVTSASKLIFWIAGIIYLVVAIKSWLLLPKNCGDAHCPVVPSGAYKEAFKNKPFIVFSIASVFIWALYAQLSLALPLKATVVLAEPKNVALVWTINSVIVIFFQTLLTKKVIERIQPLSALAVGILFITAGLASLYFAQSFFSLAISGAIFVIGEMLILPTIDSTISQLSKAELIGLFFALANVVSGLGEAGGKSIGGGLLETGGTLPWLIYGLTGIVLFFIVILLKRWGLLNTSLQRATQKENKPKHAPRMPVEPAQHRTHPFSSWEQEVFFRKKIKTE